MNGNINSAGKIYNNADELCVFPSKDQRDWNKCKDSSTIQMNKER